MLFLTHLVVALVIAVVLTLIFSMGFRRTGPWPGIVAFALLVFFAAWAGGIWISPFGPTLWGAFVMPFLVVGVIFALVLAAASPPRPQDGTTVRMERTENYTPSAEERRREVSLSIFFWTLMAILAVAVAARYLTFEAAP